MKWILCHILCLSCTGLWAENFLANPGFDELNLDGTPTQWDVFIMPENHALGQADGVAHDGDYAAMLYTPNLYAKDPINNWSQIVYDDLVGKKVTLSGHIRTEKVSKASLWIQCFSKQRSRILASASSYDTSALNGTNGWTLVSTSLTPPEGTDFLVIRCVINGQGKAWFDSLSLMEEAAVAPDLEAIELFDPELVAEVVTEVAEEPHPVVSAVQPSVESIEILAMSKLMRDTIRQLERDNRELLNRITEIQANLDQYRTELNQLNADTIQQLPLYGAHPLVPHGYIIELESE